MSPSANIRGDVPTVCLEETATRTVTCPNLLKDSLSKKVDRAFQERKRHSKIAQLSLKDGNRTHGGVKLKHVLEVDAILLAISAKMTFRFQYIFKIHLIRCMLDIVEMKVFVPADLMTK